MSSPPPEYPGPGYPPYPPGYPGYPPSYPGYRPPPGYSGYPAPGYVPDSYRPTGYPPPGYGQPGGAPPELQPGVIPLRPLSLSDIYNGAVNYIRAHPKVTLGLTAIIMVITSVITVTAQVGVLAVMERVAAHQSSYQLSGRDVAVLITSFTATAIVTSLSTTVLFGMLSVVVGRAVFGSPVSATETWAIVRGRLGTLIGLAVLIGLGTTVLAGLAMVFFAAAAVIVGMPLILALIALLAYLYVVLSFAPTVIVLERLSVFDAIVRSFTLVRNSFWRVFGILLLTLLITYLVTNAVALPFNLVGLAVGQGAESLATLSVPGVISGIGTAIGQIIGLPFAAGVVVLLYTDRRIRGEAFDLVLRTGVGGTPLTPGPTEQLWLTRPSR